MPWSPGRGWRRPEAGVRFGFLQNLSTVMPTRPRWGGAAASRGETLPSEVSFLASLRLELAYLSGVPWLRGRRAGGAGVVLRFERVRPRRATRFQPLKAREITPKFLDRTIRALKRWKFDIVSMDEACRRAVTLASRRRFVCLTFDGGYKDLVTAAYPVLSRHGAPFTVYVPTAFPDGVGEAWWLALKEVIARENRLSLVIDRTERHFNIGNASEKYQLYQFLENWMRSLAPPEVSSAINDLCRRYAVDLAALSREASMDWDDLATLAADPLVTIGSATVNYPVLSNLSDAAALDDDGAGGRAGRVSARRHAFRLSVRRSRRLSPATRCDDRRGRLRQCGVGAIRHRGSGGPNQPARASAYRLGRAAAFAARHARDSVGRHVPSGAEYSRRVTYASGLAIQLTIGIAGSTHPMPATT